MFREFQKQVSVCLLVWAFLSIVAGLLMRRKKRFWQGMGAQFISWGAIDGLIAIGGQLSAEHRLRHTSEAEMVDRLRKDTRNLRRALWFNAGLDILYMIGGLWWMRQKPNDEYQIGNGLGVFIQGAFLFVFDLYHALKIQKLADPDDETSS